MGLVDRRRRRLAAAGLALVAVALAGVAAVRATRRPPPEAMPGEPVSSAASAATRLPPPSAGPAELALVAPLVAGSVLAGFEVREIHGVEGGLMRLLCVKDRAAVRLDVALADPEGTLPPATAGRFAVYYALRGATPEEADLLARKLAKVIEANASAPPPPGMTTFTPRPKPGTTL